MTTHLVLLSDIKRAMDTNTLEPAFAERVLPLIEAASAALTQATNRRFDHYIATYYQNPLPIENGGDADSDLLLLDHDLQSVTRLVLDGEELPADAYTLYPRHSDTPAKTAVRLLSGRDWRASSVLPAEETVEISGVWGWGGDWRRLAVSLSTPVDDSTTSLALSSNVTLQQHQILRLDSEYVVVSADSTGSTAAVERAINGSIPAAHDAATPIYVFTPDILAKRLASRLTLWLSELDDQPLGTAILQIGDATQKVDLSLAPEDAQTLIQLLCRRAKVRAI